MLRSLSKELLVTRHGKPQAGTKVLKFCLVSLDKCDPTSIQLQPVMVNIVWKLESVALFPLELVCLCVCVSERVNLHIQVCFPLFCAA